MPTAHKVTQIFSYELSVDSKMNTEAGSNSAHALKCGEKIGYQ
jgi:hypothetical protein